VCRGRRAVTVVRLGKMFCVVRGVQLPVLVCLCSGSNGLMGEEMQ